MKLQRTIVVLVSLLFIVSTAVAADPDPKPDWPQVNGPFGNFNPRQYGLKLVDDLKDTRKLWVSEFKELGRAKGSSSGYVDMLADPIPSATIRPEQLPAWVVVFASSFRPRGDTTATRRRSRPTPAARSPITCSST